MTGREPGRGTESATLATLSAYGPAQLAGFLGLGRWQLERALAENLIPGPDAPRGKWSRAVAQDAAARIKDIRAAAGTIPDLGAVRAAEVLTGRLCTPVSSDGVAELGRRGVIPVTGYYKGFALYDGRALEAFTDLSAAAEATRAGQLHTADQVALYLRIRRTDLDHLTRAGLLIPAGRGHGPFDRRDTCSVPLYRTLARLPDTPRQIPRRRRARKTRQDGPDSYRHQPPEDDPGTASTEGGEQDMTALRDTWT